MESVFLCVCVCFLCVFVRVIFVRGKSLEQRHVKETNESMSRVYMHMYVHMCTVSAGGFEMRHFAP